MNDIVIGTSCYQNAKAGNLVSITGDGGNAWGFYGNSYKKMAPSLKLYEYWRDNPDHLSDEELIIYYIKEFYHHRLENLDVYEFLNTLEEKFGNNIILLCHELPNDSLILTKENFCHRVVLANYIYLKTGIIIPEVKIDEEGNIEEIKQADYTPILKKVMNNQL